MRRERRGETWLDRYKVFRRLALLWAIWLITHVTLVTFSDLDKVTGAVAASLSAVVGILTVVVGLYQGSRYREDRQRTDLFAQGYDALNSKVLGGAEGPSEVDH